MINTPIRGALLVLFLLFVSPATYAASITWISGTGSWSTAENWSTGTPPGFDDVFIDGGAITDSVVTLDQFASVASLSITAGDQLALSGTASLEIAAPGTVSNDGQILINSAASLVFSSVNLEGSGRISLSHSDATISGTGILRNTLTHTIEGYGHLGSSTLELVNEGVVTANGLGSLILSATAGTNTGILRAENAGTLWIESNVNNAGGVVEARASGLVNIEGMITGGTLRTFDTGVIAGYYGAIADLTNEGNVRVDSDLRVSGTINNNRSIVAESISHLTLERDTALAGSGTVRLGSDQAGIRGTGTLRNNPGHTIEGFGQLGSWEIALVNEGLVTANGLGNLILSATAGTNTGMLRAENAGTLWIESNVNNPGGVVEARGTGSVIIGQWGRITGGTLRTSDSGVIAGNYGAIADLTNEGKVRVDSDLRVSGTINNNGSIVADWAPSYLTLERDTVLTGSGTVRLGSDQAGIRGTGTLRNNPGHTIEGYGQLGSWEIALVNEGLVTANGFGNLILSATAGTNTGMLRAENAGTLWIESNVNNPGGVVEARGTGSVIIGQWGRITGGTLRTSDSGVIAGNYGAIADLTNEGNVRAESDLRVSGTINNNGSIVAVSASYLTLERDTVLAGSGTVSLSNDQVLVRGTGTLRNNLGHTITGIGSIAVPLENAGELSPGVDIGTIGISAPLSLETTSTLKLEIGGTFSGTDYDQISQTGQFVMTLGGSLSISIVNGFETAIAPTDTFVLISTDGSLLGGFSNVASGSRVTTTDGLGSFQVFYGTGSPQPNTVIATNFAAVPEPSALTMAFMGIGFTALARRRRTTRIR